jgi:hypothetical protein
MNAAKTVFLTFSLVVCSAAQNAESPQYRTVKDLFAAMSAFDYDRMRSVVTTDFHLLEAGEVWDIDTLISAVKPGDEPYVRRNFFRLIRSESNDDVAWVSYWNKATITLPDSVSEWIWLESALLVNENGEWKLQLLHSTPVAAGDMTEGVEFQEHID